MARRRGKGQDVALGFLLLGGLVLLGISKVVDSFGVVAVVLGCVAVLLAIVSYKARQRAVRLAHLRGKYGNEEIVQAIIHRKFWQGQTSDQLLESLGNPKDVDHKLLATRKREVWKYNQSGVNRYRLRVTLDNDIVAGWDQK